MNNFSAKNAEFETLKINNEAAITSANIGTDPNKIPLNKDLGSLAYQDAVNLDDVSADTLELRSIAAEISDSAVDVFVYDTSRDSDGGAWRKRTQHTSWYNEELNTDTRGARREFPAVAVIVAESGNVKKLKIYDGDDPDLPLWMSFEANGIGSALGRSQNGAIFGISSVCVLNGLLCVTGLGSANHIETLCQISFIDDVFWQWHKYGFGDAGISERNEAHSISAQEYRGRTSEPKNTHSYNDVAMTVLPNAPIDENTGLPVPTIAAATAGGVSVIKDDGTVANGITQKHEKIHFSKEYTLITALADSVTSDGYRISDYPLYVSGGFTFSRQYRFNQSIPSLISNEKPEDILGFGNYVVGGCSVGLNYFEEDKINNTTGSNTINGTAAYITSKYNTGWMPGDIKLGTLSDTKSGTITDLGQELVINGDFNEDISGWTIVDAVNNPLATLTWQTGTAALFRGASGDSRAYQGISTIIGKEYAVKISSNGDSFFVADSADSSAWTIVANEGSAIADSNLYYFTAITSTTYIIINNSADSSTAIFDGISMKEVSGSVINGDFSTDTSGWTQENGAISRDTTIFTNGGLKVISDGSALPMASQQITGLMVGQKYILSADAYVPDTNDIAFTATISIDNTAPGLAGSTTDWAHASTENVTNKLTVTFTATATTADLYLLVLHPGYAWGVSGDVAYFDNISVRRAVEDRSVNGNGLQVFGTVTKNPVATGADLVAYSGFSASNYLVQPYNADLDFGTGDFCVMGWTRSSGANQAYISIGPESATGARVISGVDSGNRWFFSAWDNSDDNNTRYLSRDLSVYSNAYDWVHLIGGRKDGVFFFYVNGVEMPDELNTASDSKDLTNTNATEVELTIGANWQKTVGGGEFALVRISKTAPTAEQIAKIYRDEKVLFQDGAQSTLYGSSDAVTALAYDDKTELLHVGTASGRSDFSGLRRINNTTTAVTTSISAHNNLIAEQ